jgi:hypothetical protein
VMGLQRGGEDRQLLAGLQPPEALGGFDHACCGPSERRCPLGEGERDYSGAAVALRA